MPSAHRAHAEWTPSRLIRWAETVGPETGKLVSRILESRPHPEQFTEIPTTYQDKAAEPSGRCPRGARGLQGAITDSREMPRVILFTLRPGAGLRQLP